MVTCDGNKTNISMFKVLGASLSPTNIKPYFNHPSNDSIKVFIDLDAVHMVKLVRNTAKELPLLCDTAKTKGLMVLKM
jgi:hypothetical protein